MGNKWGMQYLFSGFRPYFRIHQWWGICWEGVGNIWAVLRVGNGWGINGKYEEWGMGKCVLAILFGKL